MAEPLINRLDHVAVVSARPAELFAAYEAMGFALTPVSMHSGAFKPGDKPVPFGVGNRCAMLQSGYLELMAIFDETKPCGPFPALVRRYEGLHIVAFGCEDPEAVERAWRAAGVRVEGIVRLARELDTPDGPGVARFTLIRPPAEDTPEMRFNAIRHETPELLWQPRFLDHPNRAVALRAVTICVADPEESAARYERILGARIERLGDERRISLPHGRLSLVPAGRFGVLSQSPPFIAAFTVASANLQDTAACLAANGVAFTRETNSIRVAADGGCGAVCIFEPA